VGHVKSFGHVIRNRPTRDGALMGAATAAIHQLDRLTSGHKTVGREETAGGAGTSTERASLLQQFFKQINIPLTY
jgi:hypothetical protein